MSDTITPPTPEPAPMTAIDSLWTPQAVVAMAIVAIVAGTVAAVFVFGTPEARSQTVGGVMALGAMVGGFYFGSSKGSQAKDERTAQQPTPPGATP